MTRWWLMSAGALSLLFGLVVVASVLIGHQSPTGWLDANLERTDHDAWLSQDPPLVTADRIAGAVEPGSRVVSSWGVALRYGGGTVTVVAGPREGTSNVYWDAASARSPRRYRFGRYGWDDVPTGTSGRRPGGQGADDGALRAQAVDESVQTRRGEDFRGGGPGSGK
ncbi:MAG TPA: hypothetical protein VIL36_21675 [Acidimicrobiales bacterium]